MVSDEKQYEFVTRQLNYHNDKIIEAFNLFLKLISSIIAGSVWLISQKLDRETRALIGEIAPFFIFIGCISSILIILINLRSWWGYKKAISYLVGTEKAIPPKFPRSCSSELVMIITILISSIIIFIFLPLK